MENCPELLRVNVLGVGVSAINMEQALDQLICCIERRVRAYVVVCTVYAVMECQRNPELRSLVNRAEMVTPDGMPLVFLSHRMGYSNVDRVYGPDLMLAFSELAVQRGYTNFYYGGAEGIPEKLAEKLAQRFPGLQVVGTYSPPFRVLTEEEDEAVVNMINSANPDIVWVGLGSPKQDFWMAQHRERLKAPVLIGVGAAFDFHTGWKPQAPRWMRRYALEWLFRLCMEPRRLWKRYLINNPLFVLLVLCQVLKIRRYSL
jgi:N-acetylglucosaminyldiphosphoundecaprenol N-acetyl-beta-D-mannosaminyltransferase